MWAIWQGCSSFVSKCERLVGRILNITLVIHKHFIFQERRGGTAKAASDTSASVKEAERDKHLINLCGCAQRSKA